MELKDIQKVLILGAGAMGQQIGFVCAMHATRDLLRHSTKFEGIHEARGKLGSAFFVPVGRITMEQPSRSWAAIGDRRPGPSGQRRPGQRIQIETSIKAEALPGSTSRARSGRSLPPTHRSSCPQNSPRKPAGQKNFWRSTRSQGQQRRGRHAAPGNGPGGDPARARFAVSIGQIAIMLCRKATATFNAMLSSICTAAMTLVTPAGASRTWTGPGWG